MSNPDVSELVRTLFDTSAKAADRVMVAHRLAEKDAALDALLQVAQPDDVDELVAYAVGGCVAKSLMRKGAILQAPLANFSGAAYLGFDEAVTRG